MCGAMEDEFSDGDICGVWVYVGDTHEPTSQVELVGSLIRVLEKV